jgi:thiol-disulfide isomerase/thioredoxin
MNKNVLLGIGALVIVGGVGAFFFLNSQNASNEQVTDYEDVIEETDTTMSEEEMVDANEEMLEKQDTMMEARDESVDESSSANAGTETDAMMEEGDAMAATGGSYTDYSEDAFQAASDQKRVYFFHAAWCPTCKTADEEIRSNSDQIPEDVVVFKADYDEETALKDQYGVTYQHTFVYVDENGDMIETWNGGGIDDIVEKTQG